MAFFSGNNMVWMHFVIGVEVYKRQRCRNLNLAQYGLRKTRAYFRVILRMLPMGRRNLRNIEFWDDWIIFETRCYYPLSRKINPNRWGMSESFQYDKRRLKKVYERFEKPIVFTWNRIQKLLTNHGRTLMQRRWSIMKKCRHVAMKIQLKGMRTNHGAKYTVVEVSKLFRYEVRQHAFYAQIKIREGNRA